MRTLEQAIIWYEKFANACRYHNLTESQEEFEQLVAWLKELQERRKAPEIIRCGECRWYGRANKQRFYRGMDCLQRRMSTVVPEKDFCSKAERAERRTDG